MLDLDKLIKEYISVKKNPEYDEGYKWSYVDNLPGIFSNLDNLQEDIKKVKAPNFSPHFMMRTGAFSYYIAEKPGVLRKIFADLFNENNDVEKRINEFIMAIKQDLNSDPKWGNKSYITVGVEDASFFLFLRYPDRHLLFTRLKPFKKFGELMNFGDQFTDTQNPGKRYNSWLQYCKAQLSPMLIKYGVISKYPLLDCQDFIFCMFQDAGKEKTGETKYEKNVVSSSDERDFSKLNIILCGPPGTGKTFGTRNRAEELIST